MSTCICEIREPDKEDYHLLFVPLVDTIYASK